MCDGGHGGGAFTGNWPENRVRDHYYVTGPRVVFGETCSGRGKSKHKVTEIHVYIGWRCGHRVGQDRCNKVESQRWRSI